MVSKTCDHCGDVENTSASQGTNIWSLDIPYVIDGVGTRRAELCNKCRDLLDRVIVEFTSAAKRRGL